MQNAYRNRGLLYWKQGDAENALLDLFAARKYFPEDARLHGLLALCLQRVGQVQESIDAFTSVGAHIAIQTSLGQTNGQPSVGNQSKPLPRGGIPGAWKCLCSANGHPICSVSSESHHCSNDID